MGRWCASCRARRWPYSLDRHEGHYLNRGVHEKGSRTPAADRDVDALVRSVSADLGFKRREIVGAEIVERYIGASVNEGAPLLEAGIGPRATSRWSVALGGLVPQRVDIRSAEAAARFFFGAGASCFEFGSAW